MTGFGSGTAQFGKGKLVIEVRGVNSRFLDTKIHLPPEISDFVTIIDKIARDHLLRGRIEITARIETDCGDEILLDEDKARSVFRALCKLRDELCPEQPVPLALLMNIPDLFLVRSRPEVEQINTAVRTAAEQACVQLNEMRTTEGISLGRELAQHIANIHSLVKEIRELCPTIVDDYQERLRSRIEKILNDTDLDLDQGRLEQEVALFADRVDVSEEIARLVSHCDQFENMIVPDATPVGRRMEFLLQEMVREVNTIGSKISDIHITRPVVEIKAELERMREQAQNVL